MTIEALQKDLAIALKEKNKNKKNVIADIISTAVNMAILDKSKDNITEKIVNKAIMKVKKTCQEQIDTCPAERTDLLALYNENMEYINFYAPKEVSEKEVCNCVYEKFMELKSANKPINIGLMMKALMPELRGRADGKIINKYVTKILQENGIR